MFFEKAFSKNIKRLVCAVLVFATAFSLSSCVDVDSYLEGLIGGDTQSSTVSDPTDNSESKDDSEDSAETPDTAPEQFTVAEYSGVNGVGVAIVSYIGSDEIVKVPAVINGTSVIAVYKNAFSDRAADGETPAFAVKEVVLPSTVAYIERGAFAGCKKLKSIELPFIGGTNGANNFGYIFGDGGVPENLENVRAGGTVVADKAFADCDKLVSIELTDAENIGNDAFKNCTSLKTLLLPKTVTAMGMGVYEGCERLQTLSVPYLPAENDTWFAGSIFGGATHSGNMASMPETLQHLTVYWQGDTVPKNAFYECDRLTQINIIGNIRSVEEYAFYRCKKLSALNFTGDDEYQGVSSIGSYSFAYCSKLSALSLAEDVAVIPDYSFYSCSSIRSIKFGDNENVLPENVSSIGVGAFAYCESIVSLKLPTHIAQLPDSVFEGCAYLSAVEIPATVEAIGENAFSGCSNLNSVEFAVGGSISVIGDSAFAYCTSLKEVKLPDSVDSLGTYVFSHCWAINTVSLPNGISAIPDGCFFGCTRLQSVAFNASILSSVGTRAFSGCEYLESLRLSTKIEYIGKYAFDECKNTVFTVSIDSYAHNWLVNNGVGSDNLKLD